MAVHEIINAIPGVRRLLYLELGVDQRNTFNQVLCARKVGVDWRLKAEFESSGSGDGEWSQIHAVSTREFFATRECRFHGGWAYAPTYTIYDVVYIDASHSFIDVRDDYNDAVRLLSPGGVVFLHDLVPPDASYCSPLSCGDAWRWLLARHRQDAMAGVYVQDGDFGLTMVVNAKPFLPNLREVSDFDFQAHFCNANFRRYSLDEMVETARKL